MVVCMNGRGVVVLHNRGMLTPTDLRAERLRGKSARRIVHELLRAQIVGMELPPGTALSEAEIAKSVGVSRTPVRESLLLLAEEGLVDIYPQRGTFVAPIQFADVVGAQFIREALECTSLEQTDPLSQADLTDLRRLIDQQHTADATNDTEAFFRLDEAFHARLLEAGKHPAVWPIVAQAKSQMDRARRLSLPAGGKMSDLIAQHSAVVDALEERNVGGAVQALRHHLRVVLADIAQMRTENPGLFE